MPESACIWHCSGQDDRDLGFFAAAVQAKLCLYLPLTPAQCFICIVLKKSSCTEILAGFKLVALVLIGESAVLHSAVWPSLYLKGED